MPFYEVDVAVMVQRRIRVEAPSMEAAEELGEALVPEQTMLDTEKSLVARAAPPMLLNVSVIEAKEIAAGQTLDTYTCWACGRASLKTKWGPGWLTCPLSDCRATKAIGQLPLTGR